MYPLSRLTNSPLTPTIDPTPFQDPLQHLVACHDRIEERLQTLERLAPHLRSESEQKRQEAREALDNALNFLERMGALHTQDEEESLFPRLLVKECADMELFKELAAMLETQHREKEGVLENLLTAVKNLPPAPQLPTESQATQVSVLIDHLASLYRPHIMIENQRLIPLSAEYLKEADLEEMRQEMRNRRGL
ncbi:MAG: hemerythrin domain-containing protein [Acidobacteria bacterium]|nr:hemerythrin domain-containing protein [Acidobacteriota bacterium]